MILIFGYSISNCPVECDKIKLYWICNEKYNKGCWLKNKLENKKNKDSRDTYYMNLH